MSQRALDALRRGGRGAVRGHAADWRGCCSIYGISGPDHAVARPQRGGAHPGVAGYVGRAAGWSGAGIGRRARRWCRIPGYRLGPRGRLRQGVPVSAVPGPNAAVMALVLSGLPPQPFLFLGFPPPRSAARLAAFGTLRAAERAWLSATLLWHEAPHRLAECLADLAASFGDRPAAVARETDEAVRRSAAEDRCPSLTAHYADDAGAGGDHVGGWPGRGGRVG